ncbi:unnamed protein product [Symbiodinium microadriaticum]|nr:unnamed protein product [Symbiodinium microadriaticum]
MGGADKWADSVYLPNKVSDDVRRRAKAAAGDSDYGLAQDVDMTGYVPPGRKVPGRPDIIHPTEKCLKEREAMMWKDEPMGTPSAVSVGHEDEWTLQDLLEGKVSEYSWSVPSPPSRRHAAASWLGVCACAFGFAIQKLHNQQAVEDVACSSPQDGD